MAFIDYHHIWSGNFAKLKPSSKILLHVISGICNGITGEFFHSVETLAHLAGISQRSVQYALHELQSQDPPIISREPRPGHSDEKVHLPTLRFTQNAFSGQERGATDAPGAATDAPEGCNHFTPLNNNPNNKDLKTTAAHRIAPALIAAMTEQYGASIVQKVVVAMRSMDGEVENANAYFRRCCQRGWIPTSSKAKKKAQDEERKKAAQDRREERRQEQERREEQFRRESQDPEVQARIKLEMDKIFALLEEPEP